MIKQDSEILPDMRGQLVLKPFILISFLTQALNRENPQMPEVNILVTETPTEVSKKCPIDL